MSILKTKKLDFRLSDKLLQDLEKRFNAIADQYPELHYASRTEFFRDILAMAVPMQTFLLVSCIKEAKKNYPEGFL